MRGIAVIRPSLFRVALIALVILLVGVAPVNAAEVLQVRTASLLQVGDHNRTYTIELPCLSVPEGEEAAAVAEEAEFVALVALTVEATSKK